ncbi:hypothetical protein J2T12_003338 [Paenibacillus anaericanus]|nr:hypothetical protein [Paenibacillus anaericanus]
MLKTMEDADYSEGDGIVLEKRQRSPLPSDFYQYRWYIIRKSEGNSDRKNNPSS